MKEEDDLVLFDGDMMLTKAQRRSIMSEDGVYSYSAIEGGRWPDGIIPYVIVSSTNSENSSNYRFREFNKTQLEKIMDGINAFNALPTCLKFVERESHHEYYTKIVDELKLNSTTGFWEEKGCTSLIGRTPKAKHGSITHQSVNLEPSCLRTWDAGWDAFGT